MQTLPSTDALCQPPKHLLRQRRRQWQERERRLTDLTPRQRVQSHADYWLTTAERDIALYNLHANQVRAYGDILIECIFSLFTTL